MPDYPAENERDRLSIEATSSGIKVDLEGRPANSVGAALLDLLSPFTNTFGYVGDRIAEARRIAALRAAVKAVEMLRMEGITTGSVPPKILLPWLEGVSMELDNDKGLQDAWAGLFARAVKSSDAANISYIDTLSKLGGDEAALLDFFARDTSPFMSSLFYKDWSPKIFSDDNPLIDNVIAAINEARRKDSLGEMRETMDSLGIQGNCQVMFFSFNGQRPISTPYFDKHEHAIANLEHLGLIKIRSAKLKCEASVCEITWFQITKYAFDLFWACNGQVTGGEFEFFKRLEKSRAPDSERH